MAKVQRDKAIHGLEKLPDEVLLKFSQQEVGKWKTYAYELEDEIKELKKQLAKKEEIYKLSEEEKREVAQKAKETELWNSIRSANRSLNDQLIKARKLNKEYLNKILILSKK